MQTADTEDTGKDGQRPGAVGTDSPRPAEVVNQVAEQAQQKPAVVNRGQGLHEFIPVPSRHSGHTEKKGEREQGVEPLTR